MNRQGAKDAKGEEKELSCEYHRAKIAEVKSGRDVDDSELVLEALRAE